MNNLFEVLNKQPKEVQDRVHALALKVNDESLDNIHRAVAAVQLNDMVLLLTLVGQVEIEPRYEYKFVRGAKVKVRVN